MNFGKIIAVSWAALLLAACRGDKINLQHRTPIVLKKEIRTDTMIGDANMTFRILDHATLQQGLQGNSFYKSSSTEGKEWLKTHANPMKNYKQALSGPLTNQDWDSQEDSFLMGIPLYLLGQNLIYGGVITGISDSESQELGNAKMSSTSPTIVKAYMAQDTAERYTLQLIGCIASCNEVNPKETIISFPVVAIDSETQSVIINVATIASKLNMQSVYGYKEQSSYANLFDFSQGTLVFDIASTMIPTSPPPEDLDDTIIVTSRWYLMLTSNLAPYFTPREPTPGVGFFGVNRQNQSLITRFALDDFPFESPIHYYIKAVPEKWHPAFIKGIEDWNNAFKEILQTERQIISYEFIEPGSEAEEWIVAGDPRYNVIEWDLKNRATYGGLGPSLASPATGEIFSANTLIQGPYIMEIYHEWFGIVREVNRLRHSGQDEDATHFLVTERRKLKAQLDKLNDKAKYSVTLGDLGLTTPANDDRFHDPFMARLEFYDIPFFETFDSYMYGYFRNMVAHEIGHNLGLSHNFKGSLGSETAMGEDISDPHTTIDTTSYSVMEYVIRPHRYKAKVGFYDKMAINYGYTGQLPPRTDIFCSDYEEPTGWNPQGNGECSSYDGGYDPVGFFRSLVKKALDLVVDVDNRNGPPTWTVYDVDSEFMLAIDGLSFYAISADQYYDTWTNFNLVLGRPATASEVPSYINNLIDQLLCSTYYQYQISAKRQQLWRDTAESNWQGLVAMASQRSQELGMSFGNCQ